MTVSIETGIDHRRANDQQRLDWLRLIRSQNVGPITFRQLLTRFGSAAEALAALPDLSRRGGRRQPVRVCPVADAEAELAAASDCDAEVILLTDPTYPELLRHITDAPPVLFVRGNRAIASSSVAIVGARNASAVGMRFTGELAQALGAAGLHVISGLARGIDTAAHQGALATGTTAVLAGGVDHIYPRENLRLYDAILDVGAIVSERPPGYRPIARDFPRRNRLISGLSRGVIVVEAALRSGSLVTARLALEQGREVFAVPGSPLDPRARGTNGLIRNGAALTESADDVLAVVAPMLERTMPPPEEMSSTPIPVAKDPTQHLDLKMEVNADSADSLLSLLGHTPIDVDELVRRTQLTPAEVMTILLELELAGRIRRHPGNRVGLP